MLFPDDWNPGDPAPLWARITSWTGLLLLLVFSVILAVISVRQTFVCACAGLPIWVATMCHLAFVRRRSWFLHRWSARVWKVVLALTGSTAFLLPVVCVCTGEPLAALSSMLILTPFAVFAMFVLLANDVLRQYQKLKAYDRTTRCRQCGYDLRLTPDPEGPIAEDCPECGACVSFNG